ncbi:Hypothetical predicted protein [Mytilus galloprovincialis]|uniref:SMP-30/Gluconolactonase/LRE-like region domain-containing protein n=1 Tax=Mytilus galloprovincialis TaxID=29158 RepID=A0A8B6GIF1_MYTGA|nr:Hypothetical predicted protein [Mytilus galloprovincialis]
MFGQRFTDYDNNQEKLVGLNSNDETEYAIKLSKSYSAFDLVYIDDKTVAVTIGYSNGKVGVLIVDLTTQKIKRFIDLPDSPFGITFDGESLIWCCTSTAIFRICCTDYSFTKYTSRLMSQFPYIATHGDRIIYTAPSKNTVSCLNKRKLVWKFKNETILKKPGGITVDDKGNVFVVGIESKTIVVISPDGKQYKQIQTEDCGLTEPSTIFFDNRRKQLLITNINSFAHLYDVSYV